MPSTKTAQGRAAGLISSDWSECLSPSGPFDPISFTWPKLEDSLEGIFRSYTQGRISMSEAMRQVKEMLPEELTQELMDKYLQDRFCSYQGVPELIHWCRENGLAFMINSTGTIGYFQRALALGLLPEIDLLSACSLLRYPPGQQDPEHILELREITDKPLNTASAAEILEVPFNQVVVMGDSAGDGPHFQWAQEQGARSIGCMTKASLQDFCQEHHVQISAYIGPSYAPGQGRDPEAEDSTDFRDLIPLLQKWLLE
jgi:phosphoglycolate phosphatase-like HAD superfamily hydrolase